MTESTGSTPQKTSAMRRWLKRLVVFVVLIAMLVGVNGLYESVANSDTILEGEAGELLYVSAFDGFLDEWQLYDGQQSAQIHDDTLQINVTAPSQASWSVAQPNFKDFDITLQTTAIEGPIDNSFGIIFRLQSEAEQTCNLPMIILCDVGSLSPVFDVPIRLLVPSKTSDESKHYYTFLISSDGFYSVWKVSGGKEEKLNTWIATSAIEQDLNAENTIRVVGRGSHFQFFINGEQMQVCIPNDAEAVSTFAGGECIDGKMQSVLTDDSIATGQIGAVVQSTISGGGGVVVQFDNMTVFNPANNIKSSESNA